MKVLLVTPPYHSGVVEVAGRWMPLSLAYVAGAVRERLPRGVEVEIYDAMSKFHTHEELKKTIEEKKPDILGITAITASVEDALKVCQTAKEINPQTVTVMGGVHSHFMYSEILTGSPCGSPEERQDVGLTGHQAGRSRDSSGTAAEDTTGTGSAERHSHGTERAYSSSPVDIVVRGEGEVPFSLLVQLLREHGFPRSLRISESLTENCLSGGCSSTRPSPGLLDSVPLEKLPGLAFSLNGKIVTTPLPPPIADLDSLKPAWDLIEWSDYSYFVVPDSRLAVISSSRGCSHGCTFCSQQKFWEKKWKGRSPSAVVQEIRFLKEEFGVNVFLLADEYPTMDRKRWEDLLDLLIQEDLGVFLLLETRVEDIVRDAGIMEKYRKAGVIHVYVGVEATDQESLDYFNKRIKVEESLQAIRLINEAGMISETSFVLGMPDDTPERIEKTFRLSLYYDPDFAHYLMIAPWPYADIYQDLSPFIETREYRKYNLVDPVCRSKAMSGKELFQAVVDSYRKFYMAKLPQWARLPSSFKKDYLVKSLHLIMEHSFLTKGKEGLGSLPDEVAECLRLLKEAV